MLKRWPKEGKFVYKCKLVALIQLGQFDNALTLLKKTTVGEMGYGGVNVDIKSCALKCRVQENVEQ